MNLSKHKWSIKSIIERIKDWEEEYTELETDNLLDAIKTYITGDLSFHLLMKLLKKSEEIAPELEAILSIFVKAFHVSFQILEKFTERMAALHEYTGGELLH